MERCVLCSCDTSCSVDHQMYSFRHQIRNTGMTYIKVYHFGYTSVVVLCQKTWCRVLRDETTTTVKSLVDVKIIKLADESNAQDMGGAHIWYDHRCSL